MTLYMNIFLEKSEKKCKGSQIQMKDLELIE